MTEPVSVDRKGLAKAFAASLTGTALEWYDFAVYSAAAALVFPLVFFPDSDPLTGTLLAFSTYAVGYVARPVGGFVFGRLGDVIGRKQLLVITLLLIGVTTFAIGLIPGYDSIGIAAPIILVTMRFCQGVAVGGEWGGAVLLSSEYGDPRKRGFWSSAAQIGPPAGNLLANGALAVLTLTLTDQQFESWGWRVAFLFSAVLVGFGLWIRLKLEDTPVFKALQESGERSEAPISEVFKTELRPLVAGIMSRVAPDVIYALFTVFSITYGTQKLGFERSEVLTAILIGSAC
ncbi:MFS transporter [Rhodococcus sp. 1R11]|nr:MFS transporter [Rhodococcus sp. 1R11]